MTKLDSHVLHPVGATQGFQAESVPVTMFLAALLSVAFYNAAELTILIFLTFHRYNGLHFWSILLSTVAGIIPATTGALLDYFSIGLLWLTLCLSTIGFYFTVPEQSVVLYSRFADSGYNEYGFTHTVTTDRGFWNPQQLDEMDLNCVDVSR